ncbi:MAG: hypothetical protein IPK76_07185 [Lewinellaceae bacterium]|nr:hypothetical protein [Lewinellaceae bacterium]
MSADFKFTEFRCIENQCVVGGGANHFALSIIRLTRLDFPQMSAEKTRRCPLILNLQNSGELKINVLLGGANHFALSIIRLTRLDFPQMSAEKTRRCPLILNLQNSGELKINVLLGGANHFALSIIRFTLK